MMLRFISVNQQGAPPRRPPEGRRGADDSNVPDYTFESVIASRPEIEEGRLETWSTRGRRANLFCRRSTPCWGLINGRRSL